MIRGAYIPSFRIKQHPLEDAGEISFFYTKLSKVSMEKHESMVNFLKGEFEKNM